MNSQKSIRRSSFDILDTETKMEQMKIPKLNNKHKINPCFLINSSFFFLLIFLIIFIKIPKPESTRVKNDINLTLEKNELNYIHIDKNYKRIKPYDEEYTYIPIVTTNDIHGNFFPQEEEYTHNNKTIKYKIGGLEYISKYISILKEEFGKEGILYLDSGDFFFPPYSPKYFDGNLIIDFFNLVGLNATTLGNHEFLWKRKWIEEKMKLFKYPLLINNIVDKNGENKEIFGKNHKSSEIFEIKLKNGDIIKIGVIGLVLNLDVDKKFYDVGMKHSWNNISFQNYDYNLEKETNELRKKGANAIIILSHVGLNCTNNEETLKLKMYNKDTSQTKCEENSPIIKLINSTKLNDKNMFDVVIAGDMHNHAHIWINDIPIISTNGKGKNLDIIYLPFKKVGNNYVLINEEIKIEGPLPSCEKIFINKLNCEKIKDENDFIKSGQLVNYFWRGKKIERDNLTQSLYSKYFLQYEHLKKNFSFHFTGFNDTIEVNKLNEDNSLIEKLFLDVIKNITKADLSIIHKSMFHKSVSPGGITYDNFIKIIPYSGQLCTVNITGNELKKIIKNVQIGKNSYHPTSGIKQYIKINTEGKKEVVDVEIYDEKNNLNKIDINKIYTMATNDIVLSEDSFDDFRQKDVLDIIKNKLINNLVKCSDKDLNQILYEYFLEKKIININEVDKKERIVFLK